MGDAYVVGLDMSITASGLADCYGRSGRVGQGGVSTLPVAERSSTLVALGGRIGTWIRQGDDAGHPERLLVIEGLDARVVASARRGNAMGSERAFVWWWLVTHYLDSGWGVTVVNPTRLKMFAFSKGDANKREVLASVHSWGRWPDTGKDDNKADAAVLCAIGMSMVGAAPFTLMPYQEKVLKELTIERRGGNV